MAEACRTISRRLRWTLFSLLLICLSVLVQLNLANGEANKVAVPRYTTNNLTPTTRKNSTLTTTVFRAPLGAPPINVQIFYLPPDPTKNVQASAALNSTSSGTASKSQSQDSTQLNATTTVKPSGTLQSIARHAHNSVKVVLMLSYLGWF